MNNKSWLLTPGEDLTERVRIRKAVMSKDEVADDVEEARRRWEKRRLERQARGEVRSPKQIQSNHNILVLYPGTCILR